MPNATKPHLTAEERRILVAVAERPLPFADFWRDVGPAHATQTTVRGLVHRGLMSRSIKLVYAITSEGRHALGD